MPILKRPSLLFLLLLGACATAPSKEPTASSFKTTSQTFVFTCSDNLEFVARTDIAEAWLFLPSGTLQLPLTGESSYAKDQIHFRIDGQEASLENSGVKHLGCRNDRRQAIWEHAKLNGADYRAIGNEPGWTLEILNQESIVLTTDYGSTRHKFTIPKPQMDKTSRTTRYQAQESGHELILTISGEACLDSMSGEKFDSKATVTLDGKTLQGCGRALH